MFSYKLFQFFSDFKQNLNVLKNYRCSPLYVNLFSISERWTDGSTHGQIERQTYLAKQMCAHLHYLIPIHENGPYIIVLGLSTSKIRMNKTYIRPNGSRLSCKQSTAFARQPCSRHRFLVWVETCFTLINKFWIQHTNLECLFSGF